MEIKLKGKHLIMFSKLISKLNFKPDFKGKTQQEFGFDLFWGLLCNTYMAEEELWVLIGDIVNEKPELVREYSLEDLKDCIKVIYEKIVGFFKEPAVG